LHLGSGLSALEGRMIPARIGQLVGKEIELVAQILARVSAENWKKPRPLQLEAHLAAGGDAVQLLLPQIALARADQRHAAQRGIDIVLGIEGTGTAPKRTFTVTRPGSSCVGHICTFTPLAKSTCSMPRSTVWLSATSWWGCRWAADP
jgi:hypothetical protein